MATSEKKEIPPVKQTKKRAQCLWMKPAAIVAVGGVVEVN